MDAETLRDQWEENNDRPAWVLENREEIGEHANTSDPIPDDGMFAVRQWLESYKATVTRQLNEAVGEGDSTSDDEERADDAVSAE